MLDKAIRELDRERMGLQNQDKKLIAEIKKMAKANQMVRPGLRRGPRTVPCSRGSVAVLACPRQPLGRTLQRQADFRQSTNRAQLVRVSVCSMSAQVLTLLCPCRSR